MTYPELRAAAFVHAAELLEAFERSSVQGTIRGALVFLPEWYRQALAFSEVRYEFYTVDRLSALLLLGQPLPPDMKVRNAPSASWKILTIPAAVLCTSIASPAFSVTEFRRPLQ
jgi:hypothetical protein